VPGLRKRDIARRLTSFLELGDGRVIDASFDGARLPWMCTVEASGHSRVFRCYFWTVTHGGKHRADSEYRIQTLLTSADRRLAFGAGTTLLLGLYDAASDLAGRDLGHQIPEGMTVIVAWDPIKHIKLGASSSCQVPLDQLISAHLDGVAERTRGVRDEQTETVIAFRPEYLASYILQAAGGHDTVDVARLKATV
jgi:Methylase-associated X1